MVERGDAATSASDDSTSPTTQELWPLVQVDVRRRHGQSLLNRNRSEYAAALLARLAERSPSGARLGTKDELRQLCGVSVGTFNEAVKLAQSRGYIHSRSGPGGGIFAAEQSPIVRLGNSVLALDGEATSVADAVRIRDALDPLLIEDALWHSSAADVADMRKCLEDMDAAAEASDPVAFVHANWALHARIADVSPSAILRSVYISLLDLVEAHTLGVQETEDEPLPAFIAYRYQLHVRIVEAIEQRDRDLALHLINEHNITKPAESRQS